jgi:hypothetical protein
MPKLIGLLLILIAFETQSKTYDGYFISNSNDTSYVKFKVVTELLSSHPDLQTIQIYVRYLDARNKIQVLKPIEAKEIFFTHEEGNVRMLSRPNKHALSGNFRGDNSWLFFHLVADGKVKLFRYYYKESNMPLMMSTPAGTPGFTGGGVSPKSMYLYLLEKNSPEMLLLDMHKYDKVLPQYLWEC